MDEQEAWVDSVLGIGGQAVADDAGSAPSPDADGSTGTPADQAAVAPLSDAASTDSPEPPVAPPPVDANADRISALEAQLQQATQAAQRLEMIERAAMQQAEQQWRDQQAEDWRTRLEAAADLSPEQQQRESARIVAEIEAANASRYVPQVQQAHADTEGAAAVAVGLFHAIQNNPFIPEKVKEQVLADSRYLASLPGPEAQKTTLARDKQIAESAVAAYRAQAERAASASIASNVQQRIADGTDLVGVAPGAAGVVDDGTIDFRIDHILGNRR